MPSGEKKYYKASYIDLKMKALDKHFSAKNPQKAYQKILMEVFAEEAMELKVTQ